MADIACSDHEMIWIKILIEVRKIFSGNEDYISGEQMALFNELLGGILWETVLKGNSALESYWIFVDNLQDQGQFTLVFKKQQ